MRSRLEAVRNVLRDAPRSQRGSVLSGVLIITAFIAIISGAVMTELSTNLILSNDLMTRSGTEATVSSSMTAAFDQLQGTALGNGCPSLNPLSLNGRTAAVTYQACAPVVDSRSATYQKFGGTGQFNVDGSHFVIPRAGVDLYLVGDNAGEIYEYKVGATMPAWALPLPGRVSGPPLAVPDLAGDWDDLADIFPLTQTASSPAPCQLGGCVAVMQQSLYTAPNATCYVAAHGGVTGRPAQGVNNPTVAFFGDRAGYVYAFMAARSSQCAVQDSIVVSGSQPVIAGPLVFPGPVTATTATDQIYVLTSDGSSSHIYGFSFVTGSGLAPDIDQNASLTLDTASAVGFAADQASLPARLAVTFANGTVELVQVNANRSLSELATGTIPSGIADAPAWCCGPSPTSIAVAQTNGLYLLDTNLNLVAFHAVSGGTFSTSPAADAAGDWFVSSSDGTVYELPAVGSSPAWIGMGNGQMGPLDSGAVVMACPAGICIYTGSMDSGIFVLTLDARDVVMTACVSSTPPSCSGANPRLWAQVEIGAKGDPRTVHIRGWSYYSA